ncbi:MAG: NAD-dependent epimerase/dehydratase family protein [Candidatus Sungbacteria bacterium]|uniref:NAD-dependent epimerase/dehydratase family protein n=1 Tax=Candidatus Sungiibacteriota bacterium TaxID=2750080 RepID=A0A932VQU7_9BACT|nr:NAD-dependent epimerase/dehydratase family protein [Candidatus Sungbacteria bacterium]
MTGCAGFIGSNFVRQFRKEFPKINVIGIDDFSTGRKDALDRSIVFYEGSILDDGLLDGIFSRHKPEYVFHFAALPRVPYSVQHPRRTSEANIIGTIAILEASRKHAVKRVIFSSSSSVYGGAKKLPTKESENAPDPKSPYAAQKRASEEFCKIFSALFAIDTVCLRYFNVFGPGQYGDSPYSTVVSAWLEALYFPQKKKAFLEGDGNQSRDFCYVDNVVMANILAMRSKKNFGGKALNIAHGQRTKISEVKKLIEQYTGKKIDLERRPARVGDVRHTHADISKAGKLLGYRPKIKFEDGLAKTISWFESRARA